MKGSVFNILLVHLGYKNFSYTPMQIILCKRNRFQFCSIYAGAFSIVLKIKRQSFLINDTQHGIRSMTLVNCNICYLMKYSISLLEYTL